MRTAFSSPRFSSVVLGALVLPLLPAVAVAGKPKVLVGKLSPVVDGLRYETPSQKGVTANGKFKYVAGEAVTFSHGGVIISSVAAAPVVSPFYIADEGIAINQLHFLQALDSNKKSRGVQLKPVPSSLTFTVDFSSRESVGQLLGSIKPGSVLPEGNPTEDVQQIEASRAAVLSVATPYRAGAYEYFDAQTYRLGDSPVIPAAVDGGTLTFAKAFKLKDGKEVVANSEAFSGNASLLLADGSEMAFAFNGTGGQFSYNNATYYYQIYRFWNSPATGRVISLEVWNSPNKSQSSYLAQAEFRDPEKPNLRPKAGWDVNFSAIPSPSWLYTAEYRYNRPAQFAWNPPFSRADTDGVVELDEDHLKWELMNNDEVTASGGGPIFEFERFVGQRLTLKLTATDDEGQETSKTVEYGKYLSFKEAAKLIGGKTWMEVDPNGGNVEYYYRLNADSTAFAEYEVSYEDGAVTSVDKIGIIPVKNTAALLKHVYSPSPSEFVYEGPDPEGAEETIFVKYEQRELPSVSRIAPKP